MLSRLAKKKNKTKICVSNLEVIVAVVVCLLTFNVGSQCSKFMSSFTLYFHPAVLSSLISLTLPKFTSLLPKKNVFFYPNSCELPSNFLKLSTRLYISHLKNNHKTL